MAGSADTLAWMPADEKPPTTHRRSRSSSGLKLPPWRGAPPRPEEGYIDEDGVMHFTWFNDFLGRLADWMDEQAKAGLIRPGGTFIFKNPLRPLPPPK